MMENKKLCARCHYTVTTETYCDRCKKLVKEEERQTKANKVPDKFYRSQYWKTLRQMILVRDEYLCQICKSKNKFTVATEVDHIIPLSKGGTNSPKNLQAVCKKCHSRKTIRER